MKIIRLGIISKIKGGKGTAVKYLQDRYAAESVRYSTPLREMLDCLHIPHDRDFMQELSTYVRRKHGETIIGAEIIRRVNRLKSVDQVIEGIRRLADMEGLVPDPYFRSLYVWASPETRYARQLAFPENPGDATMTWEEFLERDNAESEKDIELIGERANYRIDNDGITKDEYHARLEAIRARMREQPEPAICL